MAWEDRAGRRYYYRKMREGRRVISEYAGNDEHADLSAEIDRLERKRRQVQRENEKREMDYWKRIDREVSEVLDLCGELTQAALVIAGYHTHKGQWRRRSGRTQID